MAEPRRQSRSLRNDLKVGITSGDSFSMQAGVRFRAVQRENFSLFPHVAIGYDRAKISGFTEVGAIDALRHGGYAADRVIAEIGASAMWEPRVNDRALRFETILGLRQVLSDTKDDMTATLVNDTRVVYPGYEGLFGGRDSIRTGQTGFRYDF